MGALDGTKIVEMAGLGPAPFAAMMLADHGAQVVRIERPGGNTWPVDILARSRQTLQVDLKQADGRALVRRLILGSDGVVEGYRPGVMERLGFDPAGLLIDKPSLVYGRMTGWGQDGPYAMAAGHDLNYIALAGALAHFGRAGEPPVPPLNLLGDFGGGGMLMAFGMVAALLSASRTGQGQVVDCAMVEGTALMMAMTWSLHATGEWNEGRGTNLLDTGAPFYDVYACADGRYIAVAALEPAFYAELVRLLDLDSALCTTQMDRATWPTLRARFTERFLTRTADAWCNILEHTDSCFAPVLTMTEALQHPHNIARKTFTSVGGIVQPAPAPRFSVTPAAELQADDADRVRIADQVLGEAGLSAAEICRLRDAKVIQ